jgi:5-methylcytosine-specific restriction protein A
MPTAPLRMCVGKPNCPNRVVHGKCHECARVSERARINRRREPVGVNGKMIDYYQSREWKSLRAQVKARDPLCRLCVMRGWYVPTQEVDHIIPREMGGADSLENCRGLCKSCHSRKTMTEDGGRRTA